MTRFETASENIARDMREGRFPQKSHPQLVDGEPLSDPQMYRGWEIWHETDWMPIAAGCEWDAYKGGVDLDAPRISGKTLAEVKAEIDKCEDEQ